MPTMSVKFIEKGDGAWNELDLDTIVNITGPDAPAIQVCAVKRGMDSGLPSVLIRMDMPDGRVVIGETSARLFVTAARAIVARHPELED